MLEIEDQKVVPCYGNHGFSSQIRMPQKGGRDNYYVR